MDVTRGGTWLCNWGRYHKNASISGDYGKLSVWIAILLCFVHFLLGHVSDAWFSLTPPSSQVACELLMALSCRSFAIYVTVVLVLLSRKTLEWKLNTCDDQLITDMSWRIKLQVSFQYDYWKSECEGVEISLLKWHSYSITWLPMSWVSFLIAEFGRPYWSEWIELF